MPSGPLNVHSVHRHSMIITWRVPSYDGGSPVTGYLIEKRDTQIPGWILVDHIKPNIYEYNVTGLMEGHRYLFRICAENRLGRGSYLETSEAVQAKSPYGESTFTDLL